MRRIGVAAAMAASGALILAACGSTTATRAAARLPTPSSTAGPASGTSPSSGTTASAPPATGTPASTGTGPSAPASAGTGPATGTTSAPAAPAGTSSATSAAAAPTLGRAGVFPYSTGFGQVRPTSVFLGGEAESAVSGITWATWGGTEATGTGMGCYYSGSTPAADCRHEPVTLYGFDLGTCQGAFMYQQLEYVFTEEGMTFDPSKGIDICTAS